MIRAQKGDPMKKVLTLAIITTLLMVVFVTGCKEQAPMYSAEQEKIIEEKQAEQPAIREMTPEDIETPEETEQEEPENETIGNRVEGDMETEEIEVASVDTPEEQKIILIYPNKTISSMNETIPVGTTLTWKNTDTWPHKLIVFTGSTTYDSKKYGEARLEGGDMWNYTFTEPGKFLVKDAFSGGVRTTVYVK